MRRFSVVLLCLSALLPLFGCYISSNNHEDKEDVAIKTPLGGMHVKTDNLKAIDVGLPEYPGAVRVSKNGKDKGSADVDLSFGKFQLHVKALEYRSSDPQEKILAFYKKALDRYGDVIECQNHNPIGTPTRTHDGLTCADEGQRGNIHTTASSGSLELKAGSKQHQHIVGIEGGDSAGTKFGLVSLDLPHIPDTNDSN